MEAVIADLCSRGLGPRLLTASTVHALRKHGIDVEIGQQLPGYKIYEYLTSHPESYSEALIASLYEENNPSASPVDGSSVETVHMKKGTLSTTAALDLTERQWVKKFPPFSRTIDSEKVIANSRALGLQDKTTALLAAYIQEKTGLAPPPEDLWRKCLRASTQELREAFTRLGVYVSPILPNLREEMLLAVWWGVYPRCV